MYYNNCYIHSNKIFFINSFQEIFNLIAKFIVLILSLKKILLSIGLSNCDFEINYNAFLYIMFAHFIYLCIKIRIEILS